MKILIDLITGLVSAVTGAINFIVSIVRDLIWFVNFLVEMLPSMSQFWTWLPAGLVYILGLTITLVVTLRILGRSD